MKKLTEYNFPKELKNMTNEELNLLCVEIREFLIDKVSKTGGHLASNLGVVELTVALHKVFDSPKDRIVWDVGHQAYVHKILTGRAKDFDGLRQLNGLSGFPKAKESEHDRFDTGHSSTSISACAGMAKARDIKGENNEVIAVIGDGALTGGMAFEALNNIGDSHSKVIVILNDNGISISPNVGGISKHLTNLRTSEGYLNLKKKIKEMGYKSESGSAISKTLANMKNDIKYLALGTGVIFEELGFTYLGPVDGHDISALIKVLNQAKSLNEPILIHVITRKGKGYRNAELNPGKFHGVGSFDPETGALVKNPKNPAYSDIVGKVLCREANSDKRICAITAAMKEATGLSDFAKLYPERFFDCGIAEQHAVTFACGLAKEGLKPVVCIYSSFMQRAYDQLIIDCAMQNLPVVFLMDRAGIVGQDGETHHGIFDLSYLQSIPNMTVLTPKDGTEFESMIKYALSLNSPCAIRYPRGETNYNAELIKPYYGTNTRIASGKDVDIWACGNFYPLGEKVRNELLIRGYRAGLVDVSIVKPLDLKPLEKTKLIVTLEDNIVTGGFGQTLKSNTKKKVMNIGWPCEFITHGSCEELMNMYGLTVGDIVDRIVKELE